MGITQIEGLYDGTSTRAVMVDSASGTAFGPLFEDASELDEFLAFTSSKIRDLRLATDQELHGWLQDFRANPASLGEEE